MVIRSARRRSLSEKCMELAVAVPQVVAHRATRAALAGSIMSEQDRREFHRMVNEKHAAFAQACWEMALQMCRVNLKLITIMVRASVAPFSSDAPSVAATVAQTQKAVMTVLDKGFAPVHRRAVLNAKRLSKIPLR
jgi:hypothetical protein